MNLFKSIRKFLSEQVYYIGFLYSDEILLAEKERFKSIHWLNLNGYNKGWFADPFFVSVSENHVELFVEEWEYSKEKGRLCLLDIDIKNDEFILDKVTPILELDSHLSFPISIKKNNNLYVYPENYQAENLKIYEYDFIKRKLVNPKILIEEPLLDTQIIEVNNMYYALGVKYITGLQKDTKTLFVYKSEDLFGPYKFVKRINNSHCEERGAGCITENNNLYYRPVQCCEGGYGKAVIINELKITPNDNIEQKELCRIKPINNKKFGMGLHSYNVMSNLHVIDGRDYRFRTIARIVRFILCKKE